MEIQSVYIIKFFDLINSEQAENTLRQFGIVRVLEAEDGNKALEKLETEKITLIFSDWDMPNLDGVAFLEKVKSDGRFQKIPFVMVSTIVDDKEMESVFQKGVDGYIAKPFSKIELKKTLEKLYK